VADLVFTKIPDCEALIADDMRDWFASDQKFTDLFPNDALKVSTDHPFVALLQQSVTEGESYQLTGFPCVTVIDTNFSKLVETPVHPQTMKILPAIVDEIKAGGRNMFIMSKQALADLEASFKSLESLPVEEQFLRAEGYQTLRRTQMAIEVWALNNVMKGKIFDLVTMYLAGQRRFSMHTESEVLIEEETITGEKSGIYNFDFGETLYGGMLRFTVAYTVGYYIVKDFTIGAGAQVTVNGLV
jgi:hypothetical protein